jgi:hypothetical protein
MSIGINCQLWRKLISTQKSHFIICESVATKHQLSSYYSLRRKKMPKKPEIGTQSWKIGESNG